MRLGSNSKKCKKPKHLLYSNLKCTGAPLVFCSNVTMFHHFHWKSGWIRSFHESRQLLWVSVETQTWICQYIHKYLFFKRVLRKKNCCKKSGIMKIPPDDDIHPKNGINGLVCDRLIIKKYLIWFLKLFKKIGNWSPIFKMGKPPRGNVFWFWMSTIYF